MLKRVAINDYMAALMKWEEKKKDRFAAEELILRIISFNANLKGYNGNLTDFLNDFMSSTASLDEKSIKEIEK
jgi:hypothetical protein